MSATSLGSRRARNAARHGVAKFPAEASDAQQVAACRPAASIHTVGKQFSSMDPKEAAASVQGSKAVHVHCTLSDRTGHAEQRWHLPCTSLALRPTTAAVKLNPALALLRWCSIETGVWQEHQPLGQSLLTHECSCQCIPKAGMLGML